MTTPPLFFFILRLFEFAKNVNSNAQHTRVCFCKPTKIQYRSWKAEASRTLIEPLSNVKGQRAETKQGGSREKQPGSREKQPGSREKQPESMEKLGEIMWKHGESMEKACESREKSLKSMEKSAESMEKSYEKLARKEKINFIINSLTCRLWGRGAAHENKSQSIIIYWYDSD